MYLNTLDWNSILLLFVSLVAAALILVVVLLAYVLSSVRRIHLPADASFATALRAAPLSVVLLLDALDLALDVFSAPFTWVLLGRLGLSPLRTVAVIKDVIPFDGFIPIMTGAWLFVRLFGVGQPYLEGSTVRAARPLLPPSVRDPRARR